MTQCGSCTADSQLWLCNPCTTELRDLLSSLLPRLDQGRWRNGLLDYLKDSAVGQTKLGSPVRRARTNARGLDGDDRIDAVVITESGHTASGGRWWVERDKYTLNRVLAAGGVNARASNLRVELFETTRQWAKHIATTNRLELAWRTTMGYTTFLRDHVHLVALDEDAGELCHRMKALVRRVENVINRPEPPIQLGPCPTMKDDQHGRRECGTTLEAVKDALDVTCPECHQTYKVDKLLELILKDADHKRFTWGEILGFMRKLPPEERVPERTLREWRNTARLKPAGYVRPDGRYSVTRHGDGDEPLYRFADIRRLRSDKPQNAATGAAAHKVS